MVRHDRGRQRLAIALVLAAIYMVAEVVGGLLANSLALLADATHMLSDVAALALSLFATWVSQRPPTSRRTFGYRRVEILAALVNGSTLLGTSIVIFIEALRRFSAPPTVDGPLMLGIASGGLLVNLAMLAVLHGDRHASLNLRGAWLHVLTDTAGSAEAIAAGVLLIVFRWQWADPLASLLISILVLYSGWRLLRETVPILMESVPEHIDLDRVSEAILAVPEVAGLHDLHIWTIATGFVALSAHVTVTSGDPGKALAAVRDVLARHFDISHSTIQVEAAEVAQLTVGTRPLRPF